jgi:hypothetical protein
MTGFFPGQESQFPVNFVCPHCDEVMPIEGNKVILCDCPESRLAQAEDRERSRSFHRQVQQRPPRRRRRER